MTEQSRYCILKIKKKRNERTSPAALLKFTAYLLIEWGLGMHL